MYIHVYIYIYIYSILFRSHLAQAILYQAILKIILLITHLMARARDKLRMMVRNRCAQYFQTTVPLWERGMGQVFEPMAMSMTRQILAQFTAADRAGTLPGWITPQYLANLHFQLLTSCAPAPAQPAPVPAESPAPSPPPPVPPPLDSPPPDSPPPVEAQAPPTPAPLTPAEEMKFFKKD